MALPIDFYFDFSSPYGYVAAHRIDAVAAVHGRAVTWHPILLGPIFKNTGGRALVKSGPGKRAYVQRDFARSARRAGLPFTMPEPFPFLAVAASRAYYGLADSDERAARRLALALFDAAFGEGRDIGKPAGVIAVAQAAGLDGSVVAGCLEDPAVKDRLRDETAQAEAAGVFGSPFFIVDGEPFWGNDRLDEVVAWIEQGGW